MRGAPMMLPLLLAACNPAPQPAREAPVQTTSQGSSQMEISRSASRQANRGPTNWFSGTATITPLFEANGSSQVGAALVRFEPGARTAWHTHPLGQRLVVLEGKGWTQVEGGAVEAFQAGDVISCPPGVRHWHGATATDAMAHIAIQESKDGSPVTWMEHVSDDQYLKGPEIGAIG